MPRRLAPLALLLALAAAGCGAEQSSSASFEGEEQRVAEVVEDLQTAGQDGEPRTICRQLLAPELVRQLQRQDGGCERVVDNALDNADNYELSVQDVTISGQTATVRVEAGDAEDEETLTLTRTGNQWRISGLGGAR